MYPCFQIHRQFRHAQEASGYPQAHSPVTGESLVVWPIPSQTQVMSPTSPTFPITANPEHNPIDIARQQPRFPVLRRRHHDFRQCKRYAEFRSIEQQSQRRSKQGFVFVRSYQLTGNRSRSCVKSFWPSGNWGGVFTENLLQQRFLVHSREGKEIESWFFCMRWEIEIISKRSLNGKLTWPFRERKRLSKNCIRSRRRLRRRIGRSAIVIILFRRSMKNLNLSDFELIKWANRQIRLREVKISLYGDLELRDRLFQENHARDCQEIEEMRRRCCEEIEQTRQARSE